VAEDFEEQWLRCGVVDEGAGDCDAELGAHKERERESY
jgi:hypothetical protein